MVRLPVVAGRFYEKPGDRLKNQIKNYVDESSEKVRAIGVVSPHAGYFYSGGVAGEVYSRIEFSPTFVILAPNHSPFGDQAAIMIDEDWETPLGIAKVNRDLARKIKEGCDIITEDPSAHRGEHSLEVQLPFLQYFEKEFDFVPISLQRYEQIDYNDCKKLGEQLANVIRNSGQEVTIIASNDMNHIDLSKFFTDKGKKLKNELENDKKAVDEILKLNPKGLFETIIRYNIGMCGLTPVTVMMTAAQNLGATRVDLVKYTNSGEVTGQYSSYVVCYLGVIIR